MGTSISVNEMKFNSIRKFFETVKLRSRVILLSLSRFETIKDNGIQHNSSISNNFKTKKTKMANNEHIRRLTDTVT